MHDAGGARPDMAIVRERVWAAAALLLAALVLGAGWLLLLRVTAAVQIDYNEGWNAFRDQTAGAGRPLYAAPPAFDITNYPPLSFHLVGLLGRLGGDVTVTGRVVSLLSLAAVCLSIRAIAAPFVAARHAGTCAALLFAVWLLAWTPGRIGVNDPQLLGMAFETVGFCSFLVHERSGRGVHRSAVLFALGVFTKLNLVALALGAGAALLAARQWRRLGAWMATGLLATALLILATGFLDGPYFLAHMMRARTYGLANLVEEGASYGLAFLPVLGIAAVWAWCNRSVPGRRPLVFAWLAAHATALAFLGGDGTGRNMFFEALVLDAVIVVIAAGDAFARHADRPMRASVAMLAVPLFVPLLLLPGRVAASVRDWQEIPRLQAEFAAGASLLRDMAAPVVCENLLLCYTAGKTSLFDPFFVLDQIRLGRIEAGDVQRLVETRRLAAVEIGDTERPQLPSHRRFTAGFLDALTRHYRIALQTSTFTIWVPASDAPAAASHSLRGAG